MDSERLEDHLMLPVQEFNEQEVLNQPDVGHIFLISGFVFFFIKCVLSFSCQRAGKETTRVRVQFFFLFFFKYFRSSIFQNVIVRVQIRIIGK